MADIDPLLLRRLASFAQGRCPSIAALESHVLNADQPLVEAHLRECPRCVNQAVDIRELLFLAGSGDAAPAELVARIMTVAADAIQSGGSSRDLPEELPILSDLRGRPAMHHRFRSRYSPALVALAASAVIAVSLSLQSRSGGLSPDSPLLAPTDTVDVRLDSTGGYAHVEGERPVVRESMSRPGGPDLSLTRSIPSDVSNRRPSQAIGELSIDLLAPADGVSTETPTPVFYWRCSSSSPVDLVFTLTRVDTDEQVFAGVLGETACSGMQGLRSADNGIRLDRGIPYRWSIRAHVGLPIRSGRIRHDREPEPSRPATGLLARSDRLFKQGLWYDALAAVSGCVTSNCDQRRAARQWTTLMDAANLPDRSLPATITYQALEPAHRPIVAAPSPTKMNGAQ